MSQNIDFTTLFDVLYDNAQGAFGSVNLITSAANYARFKIYTKDTDNNQGSIEIYEPNGKTFCSSLATTFSGSVFAKTKRWSISGTSISQINYAAYTIGNSAVSVDTTANQVSIIRVEGWKF